MLFRSRIFQADFAPAQLTDVSDPQGLLRNPNRTESGLSGTVAGLPGPRTLFAKLQQGGLTWWQPVLRQLTLLEQYYETDEMVLGICARKAQLFPRFGISAITDQMLMNEVNVSVSMAMGDPTQRLQKFLMATQHRLCRQLSETQDRGRAHSR